MRCLIAISSCWDYEKRGCNAAQRETWLPDVANFPNLEYKFFVGRGQGAENQLLVGEMPRDVIFLSEVEDDSAHITFKTQASLRWAHERNFSFVCRCFPDSYIRVERLMACGFEQHSYHGDFRHNVAWPGYASGGAGYWLDSTAIRLLISAPIPQTPTMMRVEDMWVGLSLKDVKRFDDQRFKNTRDQLPAKVNDFVTAHLSYTWRADGQLRAEPYDPKYMYAAHEVWKRS